MSLTKMDRRSEVVKGDLTGLVKVALEGGPQIDRIARCPIHVLRGDLQTSIYVGVYIEGSRMLNG